MSQRYVSKDITEANAECRTRDSLEFLQCPSCKMTVGLHCSSCRLQVTGCLCTEVDRFGQDEAWKRAVERMGEEMSREHFRRAGLYVPPMRGQ